MSGSKRRDGLSATSWLVAGGRPHQPGAPLNAPIVTASNFLAGGGSAYSREDGTDTVLALEALLGGLDGGEAVCFSSGMAAAAAVFHGLGGGARLAVPDDCYQGVALLAAEGVERHRWDLRRLSLEDTDGWRRALRECDLVWLESPSNPLLAVADVPAIAAAERRPGCLLCVDSTFATPLGQRPLEHGADVVMHSTTKFLGGHSDLLGGALVARDDEVAATLRHRRTVTGAFPGALESFLVLRGCRSLQVRLDRAQRTAAVLAERLQAHDQVSVVRYPGLDSHPSGAIARRVLDGPGAMLSFDVIGDADRAEAVCSGVALIRHATSLGGVESTMERRAGIAGQEHLPPTLLRLSVGCEDIEELWADLERALEATRV